MYKINLSTLKNSTEQEVFDQVCDHLLAQKKHSGIFSEKFYIPVSLYRGEDGLKNAAGCLIADSEYIEERMESYFWKELVVLNNVPRDHYLLIDSLQDIHDFVSAKYWEKSLRVLANEFNLEFKGKI